MNLAGLSHHKVCIVSSIDEAGNILMRISELGNENAEKYEPFKNHLLKESTVILNSSNAIGNFAKKYQMISWQIPVNVERQCYNV